jgi:hypothetical protein
MTADEFSEKADSTKDGEGVDAVTYRCTAINLAISCTR